MTQGTIDVSLTLIVAKMMEWLIWAAINKSLEAETIINASQHGSMTWGSCQTNINFFQEGYRPG